MNKHKGHILEVAVRGSGKSVSQICEKLGISRNTLYRKFQKGEVEDSFFVKIGKVIDYDFSQSLSKDYKPIPSVQNNELDFRDINGEYINKKLSKIEQAFLYEGLLDQYRCLLNILLKTSILTEDEDIKLKINNYVTNLQNNSY